MGNGHALARRNGNPCGIGDLVKSLDLHLSSNEGDLCVLLGEGEGTSGQAGIQDGSILNMEIRPRSAKTSQRT